MRRTTLGLTPQHGPRTGRELFQRNWPAIEAAASQDMGVFIISPSDKGGRLYEPSPRLTELCAPLHPLVFNALFCLSRPEVHTLNIRAAQPSDFDLALTALDFDVAETEGPAARLLEAMAQVIGDGAWARSAPVSPHGTTAPA